MRGCGTVTELPTTSQPTPGDFLAAYEELAGYDRIYSLQISAKLSGTFESARTAAAELGDKVRVVDTETASAAIAMLAFAIQRRLDRGTTDEEIDRLVERFKREAGLVFTVDTLEFLQKGGRIGKAAAFAGNLLHIKPILSIEDGEVLPIKRVRGNQKAVQEFARRFSESTRDTPNLRVGIAHADAPTGSSCAHARGRPSAAGADRRRDHAGRRRRDPCRPGHGRFLLVRGRRPGLTWASRRDGCFRWSRSSSARLAAAHRTTARPGAALTALRDEARPAPAGRTRSHACARDCAGIHLHRAEEDGRAGETDSILDDEGNVVWFRPLDTHGVADFRAQRYNGRPVLTWWRGETKKGIGNGRYVIADSSYRASRTSPPATGFRAISTSS